MKSAKARAAATRAKAKRKLISMRFASLNADVKARLVSGELTKRERLRVVESLVEAQGRDFIAGMPGGYVFKNPKTRKKDLDDKYETQRVLETIPFLDKPKVRVFERAILRACKADDIQFLKRLGRARSRKPISLPEHLRRETPKWSRKRIRRVSNFLLEYWIKPIGKVPGLCFLGPDDLVAVCNHRIGATDDEGGVTLSNLTRIVQRLGVVSAREKIPIIMVGDRMIPLKSVSTIRKSSYPRLPACACLHAASVMCGGMETCCSPAPDWRRRTHESQEYRVLNPAAAGAKDSRFSVRHRQSLISRRRVSSVWPLDMRWG